MDLKEMQTLGDGVTEHWYYRSKAAAMMRLLGSQASGVILDVGAGSAFFSRHLLAHTEASEAWCLDISYPTDLDAVELGKPIHYRRSLKHIQADVVLLMDVIEHVDDDVALLSDYASRAPNGARFLISVPAFQFLWSGHDDFLEHKRRYTRKGLRDVVRRSGLTPMQSNYYFGLVFPLAAATRLVSRWRGPSENLARSQLQNHSALVNATLTAICKAELPFMNINRLAGLTVFCLAKRS